MRDVAVGIALALSVAAFMLALWPAVAEAPWEKQEIVIRQSEVGKESLRSEASKEPPKVELCFHLLDLGAASGSDIGGRMIFLLWQKLACEDYIAGFAK